MIKFNLIDRNIYLYEGSWRNPDEDVSHKFFYYYVQPLTLAVDRTFGKQHIKPTSIIGIAGYHPFVKGDIVKLNDGMELQVGDITIEYFEGNIKIRKHLLPRVKEMVVVLE